MDIQSINEVILNLEKVKNQLLEYMKANNLSSTCDLENHFSVTNDDYMMSIYREFNDEKEKLDQNHLQISVIKVEKLFIDYGISEEEVDAIISLLAKNNFELNIKIEANITPMETEFYSQSTTTDPQANLNTLQGQINTSIIESFIADEEIPFTFDDLEEINQLPNSFLKFLKLLVFHLVKISSESKNSNEAKSKFKQHEILFNEIWKKIEIYYIYNKISNFDEAEKLKNLLQKELFENLMLKESLIIISKIKSKVIPLDMNKLKFYYEKSIIAAQKIKGKNVVALLGNSNAGKSTITLYISGSKMKEILIDKKIPHIYAESFIYPELQDIKTSYKSLSETRYVFTFKVNYEDLNLRIHGSTFTYIADLPGLFENRDIETEISNNLGVLRFLKACKTLKILYVLNYKDMVANNCQGVRDLVNVIISLVGSVEAYIDKFLFAINKATEKEFEELKGRIINLELTEAEKENTEFVRALRKIANWIKKTSFLIHPLNKEGLQDIYEKIEDIKEFKNPGEVFNLTLSPNAKLVLRDYVYSKEKFIINALDNGDKLLLINQIEELSFFNEIEEMNDLQSRLQEIFEIIKKTLDENYDKMLKIINEIKSQNILLNKSQVKEIEDLYQKLKNLDEVISLLPEDKKPTFKFSDAKHLIEEFLKEITQVNLPKEEQLDYLFFSDINKKLTNVFLLSNYLHSYKENYLKFYKNLKEKNVMNLVEDYKRCFSEFKYDESYRLFRIIKNLDKLISHFPSEFPEKFDFDTFVRFDLELNIKDAKETELTERLKKEINLIFDLNLESLCDIFTYENDIMKEDKIIKVKDLMNELNKIKDSKISYLFEKSKLRESNEKIGIAAKSYINKRNDSINSMIASNENIIIDNLLLDYESLKSISEIEQISNLVWETYSKTCDILKKILIKINDETKIFLKKIVDCSIDSDEDNIIFQKDVQSLNTLVNMVDKSELIKSLDLNFKENFYSMIKDDLNNYRIISINQANNGNSISINEVNLMPIIKSFSRLSILNGSELTTIVLKENNYDSEISNLEGKLQKFIEDQIKSINEENLDLNLKPFKNNFIKRINNIQKLKKIKKENLSQLTVTYETSLNVSNEKFKQIIFTSIKNMIDLFKIKKFTAESIEKDCKIINLGYDCLKEIEDIKIKDEYIYLFSILNENENYNLEDYNIVFSDLKQYFSKSLLDNDININLNLLRNVFELLLEKLVRFDEFNFGSKHIHTFSKLYQNCYDSIRSSIPTIEKNDKEKIASKDYQGLIENIKDIEKDFKDPINVNRYKSIEFQLKLNVRNACEKINNNLKLIHTDYLKEENIHEIDQKSEELNNIEEFLGKFFEFDEMKKTQEITSKKISNLFDQMQKQIICYFQGSQFAHAEKVLKKRASYVHILANVNNIDVEFDTIQALKKQIFLELKKFFTELPIKKYRINQPKKIFDQIDKDEIKNNIDISNDYSALKTELINIIDSNYANEIEKIVSGNGSLNKKEDLLKTLEESTDYLPEEIKNYQRIQINKETKRLEKEKTSFSALIDELIKKQNFKEINEMFDKSWSYEINEKVNKSIKEKSCQLLNELNKIFEKSEFENIRNNIINTYDHFNSLSNFSDYLLNSIKDYKSNFNKNIKKIFKDEKQIFCLSNLEFNLDLNVPQETEESSVLSENTNDFNDFSLANMYFIKELLKLINERPEITEFSSLNLGEEFQSFFKSIEVSIIKIEEKYQEKLQENIICYKSILGICKKVKHFHHHLKVLNTDEMTKVLLNETQIKYENFVKLITSFKSYDARIKEIEIYINNYKNYIKQIDFINEQIKNKDEKSLELFFGDLFSKYNSCLFFDSFLDSNYSSKKSSREIEMHLKNKGEELKKEILEFDLSSDENIKVDKLIEFNKDILILKQFSSLFTNFIDYYQIMQEKKNKIKDALKLERDAVFTDLIKINSIMNHLIKSKKISSIVKSFEKEFEDNISNYINELKIKKDPQETFNRLGLLLQDDTNYGSEIMRQYNVFDGFKNTLYKPLLEKFGIDYVIKNLKIQTIDNIDFKMNNICDQKLKDFLKDKYEEYFEVFKQLIETHLRNNEQGMVAIRDKLKTLIADDFQENKEEKIIPTNSYADIPKILGHVCAIFTIYNSKNYYNLDDTKFEDKNLLIPHPAQIIAIFEIFCLDTKKSDKIKNNLVEVCTGEGKSIILGLTSIIFALFGYEVSVACYSSNLSKRDHDSFKEIYDFFGVSNFIYYGNFNCILEKILYKEVNIKNYYKEIIFNKNENILTQFKSSKRFQVMLFDEVDIFFSKDYYGKMYSPSIEYKDKTIIALFELIWKHRTKEPDKFLTFIKESSEFIDCKNLFGKWEDLLEENLKDILNDLYNFETHQYIPLNNKIGYKENDLVVYNIRYGYKTIFAYFKEFENFKITRESLEESIGITIKCSDFSYSEIPKKFDYIFGVSGTLRTLGREQKKMIADEYDIKKYTILPSVFGNNNLQFDKINNFYIESDDIKNLNENLEEKNNNDKICNDKKDEIDNNDKTIKVDETNDEVITNKITFNGNTQYIFRINHEINKGLMGHYSRKKIRPVLIFFRDINHLNKFLSTCNFPKENFNILSERLNEKEIQKGIKDVSVNGKVTLATASFGRGYDYLITDKVLDADGGLHVIQTYLSDDMAEQIQIMGRTARQGKIGSYTLIIQYEELKKKFEITKETLEKQNSKYEYVIKARDSQNEIIFKNNKDIMEQMKNIHLDSIKLIELIKNNNLDDFEEIKNQILKLNRGVNFSPGYKARTKIYIDATSSMETLIERLKLVINIMFKKLNEILKNNYISENSFSIQIVRFRNYDVSKEDILVRSGWEMRSENLIEFLNETKCIGGWDKEAIELCLYDAAKETNELTNIIIFSDSASNNKRCTELKRSHETESFTEKNIKPFEYWNTSEFKDVIDVEKELEKVKNMNIPIYGFYVENSEKSQDKRLEAEGFFKNISSETKGFYLKVILEQENEADRLAKFISEPIIQAIGKNIGDDQKIANLIKEFEKQYV